MSDSSLSLEEKQLEQDVLSRLEHWPGGKGYVYTCIFLAFVLLWALMAWAWQIRWGLGETGLYTPVFWGVYIINFVFFIGIAHAGTLLSAILRITQARWRCPFTRIAETITVTSAPFAATCVIVDLGRPDRMTNILFYPHLTSPILWDVLCITTYIILSCTYFFIALIPDLALCRDRLTQAPGWKKALYRRLSLGWTGTQKQHRIHNYLMAGLSIVLLAVVVSVHTNVGYIFGMTTKAGWGSPLIGPYFVIGAALQGLGAIAAFAVVFRKLFHLERWITREHFRKLGAFFLAMVCFWGYCSLCEYLTAFYHGEPAHLQVMYQLFVGTYRYEGWTMLLGCFFIPFVLLVVPQWRSPRNMFLAGLACNIGMWFERFCVVVPPNSTPYLSIQVNTYYPSFVELSILAGWTAGFLLLFLIFLRLFPAITVWEVKEEALRREGVLRAS